MTKKKTENPPAKPDCWKMDFSPVLKTKADLEAADDEWRLHIEKLKQFLKSAASKIEAGEALQGSEAVFIANTLRCVAEDMSTQRKNKAGNKKTLPGDLIWRYVAEVKMNNVDLVEGKLCAKTVNKLADEYGCTYQAIKKNLEGDGIESFIRGLRLGYYDLILKRE